MEPNNEKIAIYAGTFDPPTKGHISIIKQLVEKGFIIWMIPITSPPPHKPNSNTIIHRLEMCRESIDDLDINIKCKVKVLDVAINFSEGMSAYYLMNFLENNYPEKNMRFLIGSDILQHITQWDSPDMRYISDTWYTNINGKQYKSEGDAFVNEFTDSPFTVNDPVIFADPITTKSCFGSSSPIPTNPVDPFTAKYVWEEFVVLCTIKLCPCANSIKNSDRKVTL